MGAPAPAPGPLEGSARAGWDAGASVEAGGGDGPREVPMRRGLPGGAEAATAATRAAETPPEGAGEGPRDRRTPPPTAGWGTTDRLFRSFRPCRPDGVRDPPAAVPALGAGDGVRAGALARAPLPPSSERWGVNARDPTTAGATLAPPPPADGVGDRSCGHPPKAASPRAPPPPPHRAPPPPASATACSAKSLSARQSRGEARGGGTAAVLASASASAARRSRSRLPPAAPRVSSNTPGALRPATPPAGRMPGATSARLRTSGGSRRAPALPNPPGPATGTPPSTPAARGLSLGGGDRNSRLAAAAARLSAVASLPCPAASASDASRWSSVYSFAAPRCRTLFSTSVRREGSTWGWGPSRRTFSP